MIHFQTICVSSSFLLTLVLSISTHAQATQFLVTNNCPYTVWAAADPGGGEELATGASWAISAKRGSTGARIWARTGCNSIGPNALKCATGDCGGVLRCNDYGPGGAPNTVAEYSSDPDTNLDSFDISLVDGFNVPMEFSPISGGCTKGVTCNADITGQCPGPLRANGGCNNPCTVFNTFQYCCNGLDETCHPTDYSRYFKSMCPDAYSYLMDDSGSTLSCPTGTDYRVVFCPANYSSFSFSVDPVVLCY